jgi:hypothetical protein
VFTIGGNPVKLGPVGSLMIRLPLRPFNFPQKSTRNSESGGICQHAERYNLMRRITGMKIVRCGKMHWIVSR